MYQQATKLASWKSPETLYFSGFPGMRDGVTVTRQEVF